MLTRCSDWAAEVERLLPARGRVAVELDPGSEPGAGISWNWFVTLAVGGNDLRALVAEDLTVAAFEGRDGRFEDDVELDDVPSYVVGRARAATCGGGSAMRS